MTWLAGKICPLHCWCECDNDNHIFLSCLCFPLLFLSVCASFSFLLLLSFFLSFFRCTFVSCINMKFYDIISCSISFAVQWPGIIEIIHLLVICITYPFPPAITKKCNMNWRTAFHLFPNPTKAHARMEKKNDKNSKASRSWGPLIPFEQNEAGRRAI